MDSGWVGVDTLEKANIENLSKKISLGDIFQLYSTKFTSQTRSLCRLWLFIIIMVVFVGGFFCLFLASIGHIM